MISQASQNQTDDQVMLQNKNFKLKEANEQLTRALTSDKQSIQEEVERWKNRF